jgi:hypothetical protein
MEPNATTGARKSLRGGARPGAGRPKKGQSRSLRFNALDVRAAIEAPPPTEVDALAQRYARRNIDNLVKLLLYGESESAQIAAAKGILDRGFGRPAVEIGGDAAMLPFMLPPDARSAPTVSAEVRAEAKKYANLAIMVLQKIADDGRSESARAAANLAMLDRSIGTVGKARMPDEQRERPLGKKEEAARAAETAATGRYATPSPPRFAKTSETIQ